MNERVLALDIGDVRIGVAVSDESRLIATPVEVIKRVGFGPDVKRVKQLCEQYQTSIVLSGLPFNMDGTLGFQSEKVKLFCQQLEKAGLTVYYQDERLTTVTAEHALLEDNMHRAQRRQNVDKVAAAIILQQWLDAQRMKPVNANNESEETPMTMEENNIIELIDDETGAAIPFEHLATLEYEDGWYIALMVIEDGNEDDEEGEVVIMKIENDEEGNEFYTNVEDEELAEKVFEKFLQLMDEAEEEE